MPETWEYQHINLDPGEDYFRVLRVNGLNGWEAWHMEVSATGWRTIYFKRAIVNKEP